MPNKNTTVFVTGATGFVGSYLTRRLVQDSYEVHILARQNSDAWRIKDIADKVIWHNGDLRDKQEIEKIISLVKPKGIFHLAVSGIISGIIASAQDVIANNLLGTINLIDAVNKFDYDFFINAGSFLEYGMKVAAIKESDISEPPELYSITKLAAEQYARAIAKSQHKPIVCLRLFTPYGPANKKGVLVHEIITKALNNEDINLTSPAVSRDLIYLDDVVDLFLLSAKQAKYFIGEVFNVGSGRAVTIGEVVDFVLKETKSTSQVKWGAHHGVSYDSDIWQADMTKTQANFAWQPKYSLEEGIKETIEWYKNHLKK